MSDVLDLLVTNGQAGALLVVGTSLLVGFVVWQILGMVTEQREHQVALREIDNLYELVDIRDQELLVPFKDRIMGPVIDKLSSGSRFAPNEYLEGIRSKFLRAGDLTPRAAERFIGQKIAGTIGGLGGSAFLLLSQPLGGGIADFGAAGLCAFVGVAGSDATLNRKVEARERAVLKQLPDILDLLVICVEAGLGFTAALSRTIQSADEGEISEEFSLALGQMKAGATRSEALAGMADRIRIREVQSFVNAIRQADKFGVSVSGVLREQAKDIRIGARQRAQEKAQKAPVKMLVPMVFFIFPPLFMLILGPAAINLTRGGAL